MSNVIAKPPKNIYLQIDESEVTWCADKINDDDVEYVRKDVARITVLDELVEKGFITEKQKAELLEDN